jgi:hypothetical protein
MTSAWQRPEDHEREKEYLQNEIMSKMGFLIDIPRARESGNINDDNITRRFFSGPQISSEINGIKTEIRERFSTILIAISSGSDIDVKTFDVYTSETAKIFVHGITSRQVYIQL